MLFVYVYFKIIDCFNMSSRIEILKQSGLNWWVQQLIVSRHVSYYLSKRWEFFYLPCRLVCFIVHVLIISSCLDWGLFFYRKEKLWKIYNFNAFSITYCLTVTHSNKTDNTDVILSYLSDGTINRKLYIILNKHVTWLLAKFGLLRNKLFKICTKSFEDSNKI